MKFAAKAPIPVHDLPAKSLEAAQLKAWKRTYYDANAGLQSRVDILAVAVPITKTFVMNDHTAKGKSLCLSF